MLSNIYKHVVKSILVCGVLLCLSIALVACGDTSSGSTATSSGGNSQTGGTHNGTSGSTGGTASVPTAVTSIPGTPGIGPVVILSPTPVPGGGSHSQQVVLTDRTLIINDVTQSAGANGSITVTIAIEIKNTSGKSIMNQSAYFLLTSSEGDSFGVTSSSSNSFYGAIDANSSHSGTIVFQIPSAAAKGLHLMYHPEVATETTFIPIS